ADQKLGSLLEMRCESAPVAKSDDFLKLGNEIVKQVAHKEPASVEALLAQPQMDNPGHTVNDHITDVIGRIRENMKPVRFARRQGGVRGSYAHHDGSIGVLLQVEGARADPQLLRDVCMHITAKNPVAARRADVPADAIAKEKEIALAQAAKTGKPANVQEMI